MKKQYILTSMTNYIKIPLSANNDNDAIIESLSKLGWIVSYENVPTETTPKTNEPPPPVKEEKTKETAFPSIFEFYDNGAKIDEDFDYEFYAKKYPDLENFYQPKCRESNISDKERLFYHYTFYGKKTRRFKNANEIPKEIPMNKIDDSLTIYGKSTKYDNGFNFITNRVV